MGDCAGMVAGEVAGWVVVGRFEGVFMVMVVCGSVVVGLWLGIIFTRPDASGAATLPHKEVRCPVHPRQANERCLCCLGVHAKGYQGDTFRDTCNT